MPKPPKKRRPLRVMMKKPEEKSQFDIKETPTKKDVAGPRLDDLPGTQSPVSNRPTTMAAALSDQGEKFIAHQSANPRDQSIEDAVRALEASWPPGKTLLSQYVITSSKSETVGPSKSKDRELER